MTDARVGKNVTALGAGVRGAGIGGGAAVAAPPPAYLDETYFSRRICGTGRPWPLSASKQASTMFGLPHR